MLNFLSAIFGHLLYVLKKETYFNSERSISMSKLLFFQGKEVPNSVQLFYIGCFVFIGSLFCEFIDKDDKFFTPYINEIPLTVEFFKE